MTEVFGDPHFQMAISATEAIVRQCLSHAESSTAKMSHRIESAAATSAMGRDLAGSRGGRYRLALENRVEHVETSSNALIANLNGLRLMLGGGTFYALPCITVARSVVEIAATSVWMLRSDIGVEERAARSYAAMFRTLDQGIRHTLDSDADRFRALRSKLIASLRKQDVHVLRRQKAGVVMDDIALVRVGRAQAKTTFQYGPRIDEEIRSLAGTYSALSGMAHGEQMHASSTWDSPDTAARLVGVAVERAVGAWSQSMHGWVGVTHGPFINATDHQNLMDSIPPDIAEAILGAH